MSHEAKGKSQNLFLFAKMADEKHKGVSILSQNTESLS